MSQARRRALFDGLFYVTLTALVWGLNALRRGPWQDDVELLGEAFKRASRVNFLGALVAPEGSPLRRLTVVPTAIANATPHPIWASHALSGAVWLALGLLAGWIVGLLLPGRRWTRFVVVSLTLTATSDYTTGSSVALAYNVAALLILASAGCALVWLERGSIAALAATTILLACSLLTMDVALPAVPLLAVLFVAVGGRAHARRAGGLLAAWGIVLVPIAIVEWSFLHDPTSYAALALVPLSRRALAARTIGLSVENFAPWRWAFARPVWYASSPAVIPAAWMALGSLFAAALFLLLARAKDDERAGDGRRRLLLAVFFTAMALIANAAYATVWFSEFHYRTHILSRIWASAAIGILAGSAVWRPRAPVRRWAAWGIVTAFVFFGTWGGIERQDFFAATWARHQRELTSILAAAPSLRPDTALILRGSSRSRRFMATEADYLAIHWTRLLYSNPRLRTLRLDPERGSGCQPWAGGLDCWLEGQARCVADKTCEAMRVRFDEAVVMDYDAATETYGLVRSLRNDPLGLGFELAAERYRPDDRIVVQPWTVRQRRLLLMPTK